VVPGDARVGRRRRPLGRACRRRTHIVPAGERLRQRLTVPQQPKDPAKTYAELLATDFAAWPESSWLVIDDYHHIMESAVAERLVEFLLQQAPVNVLITTRTRPSWVTARRVIYGEILELDENSLRMTDDECATVLHSSESPVDADLVSAIDGWPALVGIASLLDGSPPTRAGTTEAVLEFLRDEILTGTGAETYAFLTTLSRLPTAEDKLITRCFGVAEVATHLGALVDAGLIGTIEGTRRLHPLFREFLRTQEPMTSDQKDVIARALEFYEEEHEWECAITLAREHGHDERLAQIIGAATPDLLREGRLETLQAWLSDAGHWAFVDHELVLARAEILLRQGRPLEARVLVEEIMGAIDKKAVESEAWRILGQACHLLSEYPRGLECFERAAALAPSREAERDATWGLVICGAPLHSQQVHGYYACFEQLTSDDPNDMLRLAAGRVAIADMEGSFHGLWEHLVTRIPLLEMGTDPLAVSTLNRCLCYVSLSRGDFDSAHSFANRLISYCRKVGLTFPVSYVLVYRAMAEIGLRRFSAARRTIIEIEAAAHSLGDPHLGFDIERVRVRLALATGHGAEWVANPPTLSRPTAPVDAWADYAAICALAHSCVGDPVLALGLAREASSLCSYPSVIGASSLASSIAASRLESNRYAELSVPEAFVRCAEIESLEPVVVAYRARPELLRQVRDDLQAAKVLIRLLSASHDRQLGAAAGLQAFSDTETEGPQLLTGREQEVIQLLAQGKTTNEIADSLVIARSTAKVHINHVLRKLRSTSRLQAVLRWQELTAENRDY
jgi:LuxR family maltose regulon positive regulatory protein